MIFPQRMKADMPGDFVLFLIGMRINKPLHVHRWLPVARAMPRMLTELVQQARAAEDDAWALAAEARRRQVSGTELADALQIIELTTATRVRLEAELRRASQGGLQSAK